MDTARIVNADPETFRQLCGPAFLENLSDFFARPNSVFTDGRRRENLANLLVADLSAAVLSA